MKKSLIVFSATITVAALMSSSMLFAQNTVPYWSMAGNNNAAAGSKLGTTNSVPLRFVTSNSERMRIDSAGRVGIGTNSPVNILTVRLSGSTPAASWLSGGSSPAFIAFGESMSTGSNLVTASDVVSHRPVLNARRSRGTLASPAIVADNDFLSSLVASGYDGSNFQNPASIDFFVDGTPSPGNVPARISLVTGTNVTNRKERLKVGTTGDFNFNNDQLFLRQSDGRVGIGTTSPFAKLHVVGTSVFTDDARVNGVTVGRGSGGATTNTAVGNSGLLSNTTGYGNTALGCFALSYNTAGINNTSLGNNSMFANTTGSSNTASGSFALSRNTTGNSNTANGMSALQNTTTGEANTANGSVALINNTTGRLNTANGVAALSNNTTGSYNTADSYLALFSNITGNYNTGIGYVANVGSGDLTNATAIGAFAVADASNKVQVGNTNVTSIGGQVGWSTFSDGRYKKNIKQNVPGLAFINKLQSITYTLDVNTIETKLHSEKTINDVDGKKLPATIDDPIMKKARSEQAAIIYTGFIAQDVEKAAKSLNYDFSGVDKPKDDQQAFYGLRYGDFVVPLVKAVQELSAENEVLKSENEALKTRIDKIEQALSIKSNTSVKLSNASLDQSVPNPNTNSARITYNIPGNVTTAQLLISDMGGKKIKQIQLSNNDNGIVNIDTSRLSAGTYSYSLFVDGKLIETKKMIVTK